MCWQGFARFRCGHTQLIEEECDHARELDLPFFLKVDCPCYRISHRDPEAECGAGRFYCAETYDGQYLDTVVRQRAICEQRLTQLDAALTDKLPSWEGKVIQELKQEFTNKFQALEAYEAHPHILKIKSLRQDILRERESVFAKLQDADSTLYYSDQFFRLNVGVRPPLPGYLRQFGQPRPVPQPRRPPHNGWLAGPNYSHMRLAGASRALQNRTEVLQATVKPRASSKQTPPVEAPVRRSARGRKQVNYAEDEARPPSSPEEKVSPVAPASSLKDIILEQRRRDAARLEASTKTEVYDSSPERSSTPDTIIVQSASPQVQRPAYDAMRESFAKQVNLKPTNLTPPVIKGVRPYTISPATTGSPLKRKVLSSPTMPSNKKVHLWPPGQGAAPVSASSPPPFKTAAQKNNENVRPSSTPRRHMTAPSVKPGQWHESGTPQDEKLDFDFMHWDS